MGEGVHVPLLCTPLHLADLRITLCGGEAAMRVVVCKATPEGAPTLAETDRQLIEDQGSRDRMTDRDEDEPWYHGSPLELNVIRKGSTITQDRDLARVFSHRPRLVSVSDDGRIKHDGAMPGLLYRVAGVIEPGDIHPHPHSSMREGLEWLTDRELRVSLVSPTVVVEEERLTPQEIAELKARL